MRTIKIAAPLIGLMMTLVTLGSAQGEVDNTPPTRIVLTAGNSGPTPSGFHENGCPGRAAGKFISNRARSVTFHYSYSLFDTTARMRVATSVAYVLCKKGRDKVRPKWTETCYTWLHNMGPDRVFYRGIAINHYVWTPENGHSVNPRKYVVRNDHTHQNCRRRDIPYEDEHWLFLHKRGSKAPNARWRSLVHIKLWGNGDPAFHLPRDYAVIHPSLDFRVA